MEKIRRSYFSPMNVLLPMANIIADFISKEASLEIIFSNGYVLHRWLQDGVAFI